MGKQLNISNQNLIPEFEKEYKQKNDDFLLFDLANGKENAHTNVLWSILKYGNYMFLPSFLEYLVLPNIVINCENQPIVTTQKPAIGVNNGGKGFMDLYIQYNDTDSNPISIIIENKVCGASDTEKQLARYIATILNIPKTNFTNWVNGSSDNYDDQYNRIYVLYLSLDGTKEPNENSIPDKIRNKVNYSPISYKEEVLPWIENYVLPHIPYEGDGIMIAGIRQYIASLKKKISSGLGFNSNILDAFFKWLEKEQNCISKYNKICEIIDKIKPKKDSLKDIALEQLYKELNNYRKFIFEKDVPDGDWHLYFTPSFILMYKDSWWSEEDKKKKYNFPSIHLNCNPTSNFIKGSGVVTWFAKADRLPVNTEIEEMPNWSFEGNRNRTVSRKIDVNVTLPNPQNDECIKSYFRNVIKSDCMKETVEILDLARDEGINTNKRYQDVVLQIVRDRKIQ